MQDLTSKIQKAKAAGYSDAQIRQYMAAKGLDTSAIQQKPLIDRAADFVMKKNLPGSKIGETLGTAYQTAKLFAQGRGEDARSIAALAPKPGQVIGDAVRSVALPTSIAAAPAATVAGAATQGAAYGGLSAAGTAAAAGQSPEQIVKAGGFGALVGAAGGIFSKVIEKGISAFGSATGKTGERITQSIIKPSKVDIEDGFSIDTVKKYNLGGSIKQMQAKTDAQMDKLMKELSDKYASTPARINLNSVLENTIAKSAGSKTSTFGSNTSMDNAFAQLKAEIAALAPDGNLSIPDAVQVKRASGHYGAWLYGAPDPEASARQKVYNAFYNQLKTAIEQNSPEGVKQLNKQVSELIPVMNAIIRRIPIAERNATLSLTDIISLSASSINPSSLSVFALNQLSKSGIVGKAMMDVAPGIQNASQSLTPAITGAATSLPQVLGPGTEPPEKSQFQSPSTDATTSGIKVKGPFSGKEFEISPGGPALSARMAITPKAMTTLKTALQKALEVHTKTPKLEIAEEAANLSDMLRTLKGPLDQANFRRIIEVLKLQGKKVQPFLDYVNKHTQ